jgi:hypothetical protein
MVIVGIVWFTVIFLALATAVPSITVKEQGFRLETILGKSRWFSWTAIVKVRKSFSPVSESWYVGVRGLKWYYYPFGLISWMGNGAFMIGKTFENHKELIHIFKEKRPDLFKEGFR